MRSQTSCDEQHVVDPTSQVFVSESVYQVHEQEVRDPVGTPDSGLIEHPASNIEPWGRGHARGRPRGARHWSVETDGGQFAALLEVAIAPTPLMSDDGIA
jgi:hypothetical protein